MGTLTQKVRIKIFIWTLARPWTDRTAGPHKLLAVKMIGTRTTAVRSVQGRANVHIKFLIRTFWAKVPILKYFYGLRPNFMAHGPLDRLYSPSLLLL